MIETKNLSKSFGSTCAVRSVSFTVHPGEAAAFLGPNGAGKTTTLRMLTGYLAPTSGEAAIGGMSVTESRREVAREIGYLPERVPLYDDMTVTEYLRFVAEMKGVPGRDSLRECGRLLDLSGAHLVSNKIIGTLSRGFRQRVGIAQAMAADPSVLLLDEPTEGLDPEQAVDMRKLIRGLAGEKTVLLSTHILSEAAKMCSKMVIINEGALVATGSTADLNTMLQKGTTLHVVTRGDHDAIHAAVSRVDGVIDVVDSEARGEARSLTLRIGGGHDSRSAIARAILEAGGELEELREEKSSLEEIFLRLTAGKGDGGERG